MPAKKTALSSGSRRWQQADFTGCHDKSTHPFWLEIQEFVYACCVYVDTYYIFSRRPKKTTENPALQMTRLPL